MSEVQGGVVGTSNLLLVRSTGDKLGLQLLSEAQGWEGGEGGGSGRGVEAVL